MTSAVALAVLGHHPVTLPRSGAHAWFDAVDLVVRDEGGRVGVLGFRTSDYVMAALADGEPDWSAGAPSADHDASAPYRPLAIDLDPASVRHWDFGRVLWIGPAGNPCLVWSNAEALSMRGVWTLIGPEPTPVREGRLLDGPTGAGLPIPDALGITVPAEPAWIAYSP